MTQPNVQEASAHVPDRGPASGSLRDRLRARRDAQATERTEVFPVPGYGDELWVRLHPVAFERSRKINERTERARRSDPRAELTGFADMLLAACDSVLVRRNGDLLDLAEAERLGEDPVTLGDPRLARFLGFEATKAREVIFGVFNGNDLGLAGLFAQWATWAGEEEEAADEAFAGG